MKKTKFIGIMALSLSAMMILTGCQKETVKSTFEASQKASEDIKSTDMDIIFNINGSIKEGDTSMDLGFSGNINGKTEMDKGVVIDGNMTMNLLGMTQELPLKSYVEYRDDEQVEYTYDSESDSWSKNVSAKEDSAEELDNKLDELDYSKLYDALTLDEKTVEYNGIKAKHVYGEIKEDVLKDLVNQTKEIFKDSETESTSEIIDELFNVAGNVDDISVDGMVVGVDFYFNKKDDSFVGVKLDFSKTDWGKLVKANSTETAEEGTAFSLEFTDLFVELKINGNNNYTFSIPNEVIEKVKEDVE